MGSPQGRDDIKRELSTLSCPFTWQLSDAANYYMIQRSYTNIADDDIDEEACLSLEKLISCLVILYEKVLFAEIDRANIKLNECEKLLTELEEKREDEDIIRVIEHIFNSTKCHYLLETNNVEQLIIIFPTIIKTSDFTSIELAALAGCQSIAWSMYSDFGRKKAADLANRAIEQNSDKALWHFILAKSVRRDRRLTTFLAPPSEIERVHFKQAYEKSPNSVFGMYLAQMHRECLYTLPFDKRKDQEKLLLDLYKEILGLNDNNYKILLKLALGFIRIGSSRQSELAKYCLDAVEQLQPNNSTYFHYKGIYLEKFGNMKEALEFYKKGGELHNYAAEMDYVRCGWETNLVDPLSHLQSMLIKYAKTHNERNQEMHLCIAICYFKKKDLKCALEYFVKAIEIDPWSKKLKTRYSFLDFRTRGYDGGIYAFLKLQFLKIAANCREYRCKDEIFIRNYNKLQYFCYLYDKGFNACQVLNVEE